jgi:CBS domain-containing protein
MRHARSPFMSVQDLMTAQPRTVAPNDTLDTAARRMWEADCGVLPVLNEDGVVIAMITDRDICMATWSRNQRPEELRVSDAMSRQLVTCGPSEPLETAEGAMRLHQVRRLPVVDEGKKLLGIISLADIARATARAGRQEIARETDGLSSTLAIICEKPSLRASTTRDGSPSEPQASSSEPQASSGEPQASSSEPQASSGEPQPGKGRAA